MPKQLNVVFAGTPQFSADILKDLLKNKNINVSAIYTQPDRPTGRGKKIIPSPVKQLILDYNQANQTDIKIEQPENFKKSNIDFEDNINKLKSYSPDLIIVVAYGLILPQAVIDIPNIDCINIHTSLLPRWRGAAPIQRAILAGDKTTGVTIQKIDIGLDTGDIIESCSCEINNKETTESLTTKLNDISKELLSLVLNKYLESKVKYTKQDDSKATYAAKLDKTEALIDFNNSADFIDRQIRALNPWPSAKAQLKDDIVMKVLEAGVVISSSNNNDLVCGTIIESSRNGMTVKCGEGYLNITGLQLSGGKPITVQDALNGKFKDLFQVGLTLGS